MDISTCNSCSRRVFFSVLHLKVHIPLFPFSYSPSSLPSSVDSCLGIVATLPSLLFSFSPCSLPLSLLPLPPLPILLSLRYMILLFTHAPLLHPPPTHAPLLHPPTHATLLLPHTAQKEKGTGLNRMWSRPDPLTLMKRNCSWNLHSNSPNSKRRMTNWGVGTSHHTSTYHRVVPFFQLSFQSTPSPPHCKLSLFPFSHYISLSFSLATLLCCIHILYSLFEDSIFCAGREESLSSLSSLPVDRIRRKE